MHTTTINRYSNAGDESKSFVFLILIVSMPPIVSSHSAVSSSHFPVPHSPTHSPPPGVPQPPVPPIFVAETPTPESTFLNVKKRCKVPLLPASPIETQVHGRIFLQIQALRRL